MSGGQTDTIDAAFVPRLREEVAFVPVADEALLYVEETGQLHQLDAIGAVICRVLDGATSIRAVADELAVAFEAPRDQVEVDVLAFVVRLAGFDLLDGIEADDVVDSETVEFADGDPEVPVPDTSG